VYEGPVIDRADVVVIGSGGLGAATAFHLARRGTGRVALVDRHELGSQTSPRAAGLINHARATDYMTEMAKRAAAAFKRFSDDTGQPLDWAQPGSLKIARRAEDADVLESEFARCRRLGLNVKNISPEAAQRLNPFLHTDGVRAVLHVGDDLYFDPSQVAVGFARGAETHGATLLPGTTVERVAVEDGRVTGVETDGGTIRTPVVVDAAGAWTRQVAEASGIRIPLVPTRHQLFVTEPIEGVRADLPIVRVIDAAVYVRPCEGGLLWGGYEEDPRQFDMDDLGARFDVKDTPLDADVLRRLADDVRDQLPILSAAPVREHRGGLPTMTADRRLIVGPVPGADGFFVAGGCNVGGLSVSPVVGDALAAWIVDGEPPFDLSPLSITRFADRTYSEDELRRITAWQYRHFYAGESAQA
jgi:4-methylaminobutanoate oxidase (formaldehyde-forming)